MYVDEMTTKNVMYSPQSKKCAKDMIQRSAQMLADDANIATLYFYLESMILKANLEILYRRFSWQKNATDDTILQGMLQDENAEYEFLTLRERMKYNPYQLAEIVKSFEVLHSCEHFVRILELPVEVADVIQSDEMFQKLEKIVL